MLERLGRYAEIYRKIDERKKALETSQTTQPACPDHSEGGASPIWNRLLPYLMDRHRRRSAWRYVEMDSTKAPLCMRRQLSDEAQIGTQKLFSDIRRGFRRDIVV